VTTIRVVAPISGRCEDPDSNGFDGVEGERVDARIQVKGLGSAAAAAVATALMVAPCAHAAEDCSVVGPVLELHHGGGYDIAVDAEGSSLGPAVLVRTPEATSLGNITSGSEISGRSIDFTLGWPGTLAYVHYTGIVDRDGIARGTSTDTMVPINLQAGPWHSMTPLACP
jgi:hypothetical protein